MSSHLSSVLKQRRKELGLTLAQIADAMDVTEATVQRWESGNIKSVRYEKISKLADVLKVSPSLLMGWDDSTDLLPNNIAPMPQMRRWKVLGGTACGEPMHLELDETVWAPDNIDADFVFRCVGDSMIGARILDGDLVFVKAGENVDSGQIAVVRIEDSYSLKRIYRGADYLELRSENPKYSPIVIHGEQENAEIVGRAVHFLSSVI